MNIAITTLAIFGALWLTIRILLPLAEALWYGLVITILYGISGGWKSLHPRYWWFFIRWPWVVAWQRLFGLLRFSVEQSTGDFIFAPPFGIRRNRK